MLTRLIASVIVILAIVSTVFTQTPTPDPEARKKEDELRSQAVGFLRDANAEVGTLRTLENRISFSSEMAGLMWLYDEKESRAMYGTVISDFKLLIAEYDSQLNALQMTKREIEKGRRDVASGDDSDRAKILQKFYRAMNVRSSVAMSLAEHDPSLAYDFFYDTLALVTNEDVRKQVDGDDGRFEMALVAKFLEKDPARALQVAKRSINTGVSWAQFEMLRAIYEKDNEKGAELASAMIAKVKADRKADGSDPSYQLLSMAIVAKPGGKNQQPLMTAEQQRDLADTIARDILARDPDNAGDVVSQTQVIAKILPARAQQIKAKFPDRFKGVEFNAKEVAAPSPAFANATPLISEEEAAEQEATKEKNEAFENVKKLSDGKVSKEDRDKIVARAREIISGLGGRSEKIMAISMLAQQVAMTGDKELGVEIMRDAAGLVNPSPKSYRDYLEMWMLVGAYAQTDPDKAFPLLEEGVVRLNDTLSAFIKVGEFMDVSGELVDDNEVQVGAMGGSMVSSLTGSLGAATPTLRALAASDFTRTKNLTNRFDRPEIRLLAKMMIIRAVLGNGEPEEKPDVAEKKDDGR